MENLGEGGDLSADFLMQEIASLEGQDSPEALELLATYSELLDLLLSEDTTLPLPSSSSPPHPSTSSPSEENEDKEWGWMKLRNNDISPPLSNFSAPLASPSPAPSPSPSLPPPPPLVEDDYDPFASDDEEEVRGREDKEVHLAHWEQHTNGFGSRMLLKLGYKEGEGIGKEGKKGMNEPLDIRFETDVEGGGKGGNLGLGHRKRRRKGEEEKDDDVVFQMFKQNQKKSSMEALERRQKDVNNFFSFLNSKIDGGEGGGRGGGGKVGGAGKGREGKGELRQLKRFKSDKGEWMGGEAVVKAELWGEKGKGGGKGGGEAAAGGGGKEKQREKAVLHRLAEDEKMEALLIKKQKLEEGIARNKARGSTTTVAALEAKLAGVSAEMSRIGASRAGLSKKMKKAKEKEKFMKF